MSIVSKVRKGSLWIACTRLLTNGLGFVSTLVTARLLTPDDFGIVAIGMTILTIVTSITDLSLSQALIHCEQPDEGHLNTAFTLNMFRGLILGAVFVLSAPLVAEFYGDERLIPVMLAIALAVFIQGLENPRLAMLKKDMIFWQDFVLGVISKITMIVIAITVALLTRSYIALVAATVGSSLAQQIASYFFVPHRPRLRLKEYKDLLGFSGWMTLSQIVSTLNWRLDPLIVGKFLGPFDLGLVTVASRLAQLPVKETTVPLTGTLFPAFRQIRDDAQRLAAAFMRAQTLISAIAMLAGGLLSILAQPLVLLVMGEKWLPSVVIIQVLSVTLALQTLGTVAYPLALATGQTRLLFRRSLQGLSFRLPIVMTGLYLDGLRGFLIARCILCFTSIMLDMLIVREVAGLSHLRQLRGNWRTIAAFLTMSGATYLLGLGLDLGTAPLELAYTILLKGTLAALTYMFTMFVLWTAAGRPLGPEKEISHLVSSLIIRGRQLSYFRSA